MLLIVSPKNVYATRRLKEECARLSMEADFFDVKELAARNFEIEIEKYSALYIRQAWPYFEEIISLAKKFADTGKRVVDSNMANGDIDVSKWQMYVQLHTASLPVPQTQLLTHVIPEATIHHGGEGYPGPIFLDLRLRGDDKLQYPCIIKWVYGFGGKQVYYVKDEKGLQKVLALHPQNELISQELIHAQYEYKVIAVGYKSLPVIMRFEVNKKTYRQNLQQFEVIDFQNKEIAPVIHLAEQAAAVLKRELAKVDILEDANGALYILEVNRQPGFQNFEKLSGFNVAEVFVNYVSLSLREV
jgi:glutathione synthase/RimK-type ligase-like ATP-grasp enzyme